MWFIALLCFALVSGLTPGLAHALVTPDSAPPGATVTIVGKGFGPYQSTEANQVLFNHLPALVQRWEPDFIEVRVPHKATTGPVLVLHNTIEIPVGTFTVRQPRIQSLSVQEIEPGKILQIYGKHFGPTAGSRDPNTMFGVNQVWVGGVKAQVQKWREDKIAVLIPATAKSGEVTVRLASSDPLPNGYCCAPVEYTVSNPIPVTLLPSIQVDPRRGPIGTKVVLFGEGFGAKPGPGDLVLLNGRPTTLAQWGQKAIVVHLPLHATSGPLVLKQGGKERELGLFTVLESTVTRISPAQGPIGSLLRIYGKNFGAYTESGATPFSFIDFNPGQNRVTIGGVPAIVYRWSEDLIDVWVPFSAKDGPVLVQRGGTIPKPDGTCCVDRGVVSLEAGVFSVITPTIDSYSPTSAGLDEIVTITGSGFGRFLKGREATDPVLGINAFLSKPIRLGENISRTEVLFNGFAALITSWTETEIKVQVPRRHLFGIGTVTEFHTDLSKGPLEIRRGSWDLLPDGTCCTEKKWISVKAGEFTIEAKGLPDQGFFNDPNQSYP